VRHDGPVTTAFDVLGAAGSIAGVVGVGAQFYSMRRERAARRREPVWPHPVYQQPQHPHQQYVQQATPHLELAQRPPHQPYPQPVQPWATPGFQSPTLQTPSARRPTLRPPDAQTPTAPPQPVSPVSPGTGWDHAGSTAPPGGAGWAAGSGGDGWAPPASPAGSQAYSGAPIAYTGARPAATRSGAGSIVAGAAMSLYLFTFAVLGFGWLVEPWDATIPADSLPSDVRIGMIWLLTNTLWAAALVVKHARRQPPSRRRWAYVAAGALSLLFAILIPIVDHNVVF
jgi:hypothetical protein